MKSSKVDTFINGISIQTIVVFVMGGLEMVLFSLFSRFLSKSDFGYFAALMAVIVVLNGVAEAGLGSAIIQKKGATEKYISTAFTLSISIGLVFSILLFFLAPYIAILVSDSALATAMKIMSVIFVLNSLNSVGFSLLYKDLKFKRAGIIKCSSYFISGVVGVWMSISGFGFISIVLCMLMNSLLSIIFIYCTSIKVPKFYIEKTEVSNIVSFGGWLTLGVMLNNITHQLDKLLTSRLLSVEMLGAYNRPAGFTSNLTSKITGIFDNVLFPMLSNIQDEKERVVSIFYKAVALLNSISSVLSAIFFFNAELIIIVFFGEKWMDLVPIMRIISISVLFNVDGQLVDCFFRSLNYVKTGFYLRIVGAVLTLFCIIIGTHWGIKGLAIAIVIANVSLILMKIVVLCVKVHANLFHTLRVWISAWRPILILVIIGSFSFIIQPSLYKYIIIATLFAITTVFEFCFFPEMVSQEYKIIIYPKVNNIKKKLFHKCGF